MSGTGEDDAGIAAAVLGTMQQVGSVVGLAALVGPAAHRTERLVDAGAPASER